MRKLMVEFLSKFVNRAIKIARVNSIRITKSINLLSFCTVLGSVVMLTFLNLPPDPCPLIEKSVS